MALALLYRVVMKRMIFFRASSAAFIWLSLAPSSYAEPARGARPEPGWSTGPKLQLEQKINVVPEKDAPELLLREKARLRSENLGERRGIRGDDDLRNYLQGHGGDPGAIGRLAERGKGKPVDGRALPKAINAANQSARDARVRIESLLKQEHVDGDQLRSLQEIMVWRSLAYNSSTLAHGSFGPKDGPNEVIAKAARDGLLAAIDRSFSVGDRLAESVKSQDKSKFLKLDDFKDLHWDTVRFLPDGMVQKEREVRTWSFGSGFGVAGSENNRGIVSPMNPSLQEARQKRGLPATESVLDSRIRASQNLLDRLTDSKDWSKTVSENPLLLIGASEYALHNEHWFRDGNGRTESLATLPLSRAAGFPLPIEYDQLSGDFRLAAQKWGGTRLDMYEFLAKGAQATERFAKAALSVIGGDKIVSTLTDRGTVASVLEAKGGERSLMVMMPVTHAHGAEGDIAKVAEKDAELKELIERDRIVTAGGAFEPKKLKLELSVNGRENQWQRVDARAVNQFASRYDWWSTAEPIFKVL